MEIFWQKYARTLDYEHYIAVTALVNLKWQKKGERWVIFILKIAASRFKWRGLSYIPMVGSFWTRSEFWKPETSAFGYVISESPVVIILSSWKEGHSSHSLSTFSVLDVMLNRGGRSPVFLPKETSHHSVLIPEVWYQFQTSLGINYLQKIWLCSDGSFLVRNCLKAWNQMPVVAFPRSDDLASSRCR